MKVAVCCPSVGLIRAKCAQSLNGLIAHTLNIRITYNGAITRPQFEFLYEEAGPLEYKRTRLALRALEWGADYLLLIDWDHVFPPDALIRLAAHDKPFVAANYPMRHGSPVATALRSENDRASGRGLQRVSAAGLGFALVKAQVFSTTPQPWFRTHMSEAGELLRGEDVHFCNQVRRAGIPIYVDHDLVVGHIAETVLTLEGGSANADSVLSAAGT